MLWGSWWGRLLPLQPDRLLAAQDGTGSADGGHEQVQVVLVLADHFQGAVEGGPGVLVDGGLHVGGGRLSLSGSPLHDNRHAFAMGRWLPAHHLAANQPIVAEGVTDVQFIGLGAICMLFLLIRKLEYLCRTIIRCRRADMETSSLA